MARHTVQLPGDSVLALRDDATAKHLLTTFKLVSDESKDAKEAAEVDQRVRAPRERSRLLGNGLGSIILRSKRHQFFAGVQAIREAIAKFRTKTLERLETELPDSRKTLGEGLLPAVNKSTLPAVQAQVSGKPTAEVLRRYLDDELTRVFSSGSSVIGEMKLEWVPKSVTYETLSNPEFQRRVRAAFPYENWDKPFREFEAVPTAGRTGLLFD